jgi:superfamily II DNA or RNA helicase
MIRPRPYQQEALDRTISMLCDYKSLLVVMPTGMGKTVFFSLLAASQQRRVLVVAHRDELIRQAADKLKSICMETVGIEKAEETSDGERLIVTSVQTMSKTRRHSKLSPSEFDLVIIDEAHHALGNTYRTVVDHFMSNPDCRLVGVTATPKRHDQQAMGQIFDDVSYEYSIENAVGDGWLVPIVQHSVQVDDLDFSGVKTTAGDLNEGELERILSQERIIHRIAAPLVDIAADKPTIVFCASVNHSRMMMEVINRYKPHSAGFLCGETPTEERRTLIKKYGEGDLQFLCQCGVLAEGFDAPATAIVAMGRPTKSLGAYMQWLGRGTRPLPGVVDAFAYGTPDERKNAIASSQKPHMEVIDFVGNCGRHKLITAHDILGGKYGEQVRSYAKQTQQEEQKSQDIEKALARASDELTLLEEIAERKRKEEIKAKAKFWSEKVDAFSGERLKSKVKHEQAQEPATDRQIWVLVRRLNFSVEKARSMSKRQAGKIIGIYMSRGH